MLVKHHGRERPRIVFKPGQDWFGYGGSRIGPAHEGRRQALNWGLRAARAIALESIKSRPMQAIAAGVTALLAGRSKRVLPPRQKEAAMVARRRGGVRAGINHLPQMRRTYKKTKRGGVRSGTGKRGRVFKRRKYVKKNTRKYYKKRFYKKKTATSALYKNVVKGSKPTQYDYSIGFGADSDQTGFSAVFNPMFDYFNAYDLNVLGNGVNPGESSFMDCNIDTPQVLQNMNAANAFVSVTGVPSNIADSEDMFIVGPRSYKWQLNNFEVHPINVKIYLCKARHDIPATHTAFVSGDLTKTGIASDMNDFIARCFDRDKIIDYAPSHAGATGKELKELNPAFTLYQSTSFCKWFKILSTKSLEIKTGECKTLTYTAKKPWRMTDYVGGSLESLFAFGGKSIFLVFQIIGCPVLDGENLNREQLGRARMSVHHTMRCKVYQLNQAKQGYKQLELDAPGGAVNPANAIYAAAPLPVLVNEN